MKRLLNIWLVSLLSLMVVYLSVGATIMHCLRSNEVKVVLAEGDCCAKKCNGCCADDCQQQMAEDGQQMKHGNQHHALHGEGQLQKHCMDYQLLKLSPTLSIQKAEFDASPVFAGILPAAWLALPRPVVSYIHHAELKDYVVPHAPPRAYLAWINSLII